MEIPKPPAQVKREFLYRGRRLFRITLLGGDAYGPHFERVEVSLATRRYVARRDRVHGGMRGSGERECGHESRCPSVRVSAGLRDLARWPTRHRRIRTLRPLRNAVSDYVHVPRRCGRGDRQRVPHDALLLLVRRGNDAHGPLPVTSVDHSQHQICVPVLDAS